MTEEFNKTDHDLLIELNQIVKGIETDIKGLRNTTDLRVNDHESRIRNLENRIWLMSGSFVIIAFAAPYVWDLFTG